MRSWTVTTRYEGQTELQVMLFPWQRMAYGFAIDWFTDDEGLEMIEVVDDRGYADTLTLNR
ncbi:MAG: hypothetical protein GY906_10140 [bacterium]|nr:hypothetical protein [bacterium]